jgi:GT2 family glycosyltransferase
MKTSPPEISVILITGDSYDTLRKTMARLREQTIRERIEIVVAALDADSVHPDAEDLAAFYSVKVVQCTSGNLLANAAATGVRQATAPVAAMIEDHCYPDPGWAEALLARHRQGYAAVGAEIRNANPESAVSWCSFLLTLGNWAPPAQAGEVATVASHNSSYLRSAVLDLGEDLDKLMASETVLNWRLRDAGHRLFLEPAAKAAHVNPSRLGTFAYVRFHSGRVFAATFSHGWPFLRRLRFAAVSPLAEIKRLAGIMSAAQRRNTPVSMLRLAPLFSLAWFLSSVGYIAGSLAGAGDSLPFASVLYFGRAKTLNTSDRKRNLVST